eukprot:322711-Hanusia_phi.AAC.1
MLKSRILKTLRLSYPGAAMIVSDDPTTEAGTVTRGQVYCDGPPGGYRAAGHTPGRVAALGPYRPIVRGGPGPGPAGPGPGSRR